MTLQVSRRSSSRQGVILLVVLGSLTFFSILVAAYLVFSNESRDASFARSQQEIRTPDVDWMMNEALMTLVRGTEDTSNPFYGEDLLSDFYGLHDGLDVAGSAVAAPANGFFRIRLGNLSGASLVRPSGLLAVDDVYAGRLITFKQGPLQNRTYRILRSEYTPTPSPHDVVLIELDGTEPITSNSPADWFALGSDYFPIRVNGIPRSANGLGFNGSGYSVGVRPEFPADAYQTTPPTLPAVLQPSHLNFGNNRIDKSLVIGDVDEGYDAADFNNWFMSHRREDGTVIPSFHRPSVINYIINQQPLSQELLASIRRATFRPLPFAENSLRPGQQPINSGFTGGSSSYALRVPLRLDTDARLNQLAESLINGQWDVDNDSDGQEDSIWVNLGLPTFVTQEGKLIQPLIAPMIEDLGGRLNLNAHGNTEIKGLVATAGVPLNTQVAWAGQPTTAKPLYRGLGWGPAEINLPQTAGADNADGALLADLIDRRYATDRRLNGRTFDPGVAGRDGLDVLASGFRPPFHSGISGFGGTTDPFGRAATGLGRSGHVLSAPQNVTSPPREDVNHPYEVDPTGELSGDALFTLNDLEAILRADDFDSELLPIDLRQRLISLVRDHADYRHAFTTKSTSDDSPGVSLMDLVSRGSLRTFILTQAGLDPSTQDLTDIPHNALQPWYEKLFPPELRLGKKLDVNRAIGNNFDDDGDLVIDEPGEVANELEAFRLARNASGNIPGGFSSVRPFYTWDETAAVGNQIPVTGRQLLARHLYVLAMALRHDPTDPTETPALLTAVEPDSLDEENYTARRLAQWAVNVVDYRDPDSIMTRFAFDPQPFDANGWTVNDDLTSPQDSRFVVWGVEEPHLMFSEGLALHDVRVRDTDRDSSGEFKKENNNPADDTTDQVRIPQGSLFLELYCPHPTVNNDDATKPGFPMELYQQSPTGPQLNLAASAPRLNATAPYGAPVWRIAISERHDAQAAPEKRDLAPAEQRGTLPDTASFEVNQPNELGPSGEPDNLELERFILFTNAQDIDTDPDSAYTQINNLVTGNQIADMSAERVFIAPSFSSDASINSDRLLEPGQFLVLAPRLTTYLGSSFDFGNPNSNAGGNGNGNAFGLQNRLTPAGPSDQMIRIETLNGFQQLGHYGIENSDNDNVGDRATPLLSVAGQGTAYGARALPLVIAAPRRTGWEATVYETGAVGLNISEPLPRGTSFYTQPSLRYFGNQPFPDGGTYNLTDAYLDYSDTNDTALNSPADGGFDFIPTIADEPVLGTIDNYRSAFLQRLADPTLPYNPVTNPYRTVDWFQLDLTVFSGEEREDYVIENQEGNYARRSRQRNGEVRYPNDLTTSVQANALYSYESESDSGNIKLDSNGFSAGTSGHYFKFEAAYPGDDGKLHTSLSFLNCEHPVANPGDNQLGDGFQGYGLPLGTSVTGMDANLPRNPYAVHPWLNRPFATPYELMMVPAASAGRLFEEFTVPSFNPLQNPLPLLYDPPVYADGNADDVGVVQSPYRHLLNFFTSDYPGSGTEKSLDLSRLFELVHTRPRFRGEVDYLLPLRVAGLPPETQSLLRPPFNQVYDNQRQGVVNLNAISGFPVWAGLMQGHLNQTEFESKIGSGSPSAPEQLSFQAFLDSRRGFDKSDPNSDRSAGKLNYDGELNPDYPTQFAGVFQSAIKAEMGQLNGLKRSPVNATLLRDTNDVNVSAPEQKSLFVREVGIPPDGQAPVVTAANPNPESNRLASPFMRYQTLMRMPNLVSNNSQVFLLRMTLGFFEVDAATGELGREYNADAGTSERFKATFVVDRSIPVGFEPGKDLNARDVVVFESYGQ